MIIFLDIDGVLNSEAWFLRNQDAIRSSTSLLSRGVAELDPEKVKLMSDFVIEVDAQVVISSSWRFLHDLKTISEMLKAAGWTADEPHDVTPRSWSGHRGKEVNDWLELWSCTHMPHLIFDDDSDFSEDQPLIRTSWKTGVTEKDIEIARMLCVK